MKTQEILAPFDLPRFEALFDWEPDLERFERDVAEAVAREFGDPLTLAEMECSLDLIDGELMTLRCRGGAARDGTELADLRGRLADLIERLRPLVPDY